MRRIPWGILLALLAGFGLGLAYSWLFSPLQVTDAIPLALRADFKDSYRSAIAASFAATGNMPRAQARLSLLGDASSIEALNSQAQRLIASGEFAQADQLVALAIALDSGTVFDPPPTPTTENIDPTSIPANTTFTPSTQDSPPEFTETPPVGETETVDTPPAAEEPTPRPTRTPIPTFGVPFALASQVNVCDSNLPDGLLQVIVFNSNRRQVPGAKIIITWESGEEQFFTGLKPELGNGYADYSMSSNITYTLRLASGSDIASGLTPPTCQTSSGETYLGGIKLTFEQP